MSHNHSDTEQTVDAVRRRCEEIFRAVGVPFAPLVHEPVLDYETAARVRDRFGLTGTETKALFLRRRSGAYVMFVSLESERLDASKARELLGEKVSIAAGDELSTETGCIPGCAVPLGLPEKIVLLLDRKVRTPARLIFSPGPPTETIEISAGEWESLLSAVPNQIVEY